MKSLEAKKGLSNIRWNTDIDICMERLPFRQKPPPFGTNVKAFGEDPSFAVG